MNSAGDIILMKDLWFGNENGDFYHDHAHKTGRPCIVVGEDEENIFFLTCSSKTANFDSYLNRRNNIYYIDKNNIITTTKLSSCVADIRDIWQTPNSFIGFTYLGQIEHFTFLDMLEYMILQHNDQAIAKTLIKSRTLYRKRL